MHNVFRYYSACGNVNNALDLIVFRCFGALKTNYLVCGYYTRKISLLLAPLHL